MEDDISNQVKAKNLVWLWVSLGVLIVLIIAGGLYWRFSASKKSSETSSFTSNNQPVTIPRKVLANKFGWLGGGAGDEGATISDSGGAWVRPHPGAFVWDMMQKEGENIDFSLSDQEIKNYQKNNLGILVTLWPFADWDQQKLANAAACAVSDNDEFLPKNDQKGRGSYLPKYRCNPNDWEAYTKWVTALVERYDGDGKDDMPGLIIPVKYWEVMNEPDLNYQSNLPASESSRLNFYKQGPSEYATLLVNTYKAIKAADPESKVLIAGAAGGDTRMLNFYRAVFSSAEAKTAFDIGNVHCISNDQQTHDFNVAVYKKMLAEFNITKPIWVTEAEAFYRENKTAEQNYQSTKTAVANAIAAGAERIFFTRYTFDDFRTDMSQKTESGNYPSSEKYKEIIESY
jgi:hypothetical protein